MKKWQVRMRPPAWDAYCIEQRRLMPAEAPWFTVAVESAEVSGRMVPADALDFYPTQTHEYREVEE